jgi:two-component system sensor histidine kinase KdpD
VKKGTARGRVGAGLRGYAAGAAIIAACTVLSMAGAGVLEATAFLMLFPVAILVVTARFGLGAAVFATAAGIAAFDFVFIPPELAFAIPDFKNGMTLIVMVGVVAVASGLAEHLRRQADAARHQAEIQALRNALLSGLSHDLRSPLTALLSASEALHDGGADARHRDEFSRMVEDEVGRMSRLVGSLLDLTRLEAVREKGSHELQSIEEVIGAVLRRYEGQLAGCAVSTDVPEDVPLVAFDPVLIEQVMINLVENVIKHAGPRCALDIRVRGEGPGIVVEVADRGPGVPAGEEERVFEKHHRTGLKSGSRPGVGLGLTICRAIVQAHGGEIALENRPGGGAVVRFTLPAPSRPSAAVERAGHAFAALRIH